MSTHSEQTMNLICFSTPKKNLSQKGHESIFQSISRAEYLLLVFGECRYCREKNETKQKMWSGVFPNSKDGWSFLVSMFPISSWLTTDKSRWKPGKIRGNYMKPIQTWCSIFPQNCHRFVSSLILPKMGTKSLAWISAFYLGWRACSHVQEQTLALPPVLGGVDVQMVILPHQKDEKDTYENVVPMFAPRVIGNSNIPQCRRHNNEPKSVVFNVRSKSYRQQRQPPVPQI